MKSYPRVRFGLAVAGAFICGLIFASGLDLTRFGWAQTRVTSGAAQVPAPAVASLVETQNAFEAIVDRVKPAVVSIHVARYAQEVAQRQGQGQGRRGQPARPQNVPPGLEEFMRQFGDIEIPDPNSGPRQGSGSGFLVSKDGYILTNNHVVANMDRVTVTLVDKRTFNAKVIGKDPTTDVAVIKIEGNDFPFISLGDESTARVGQWVLAIGNPLDLDFTVTAGIISAKNRRVDNLPGRTDYSITDFIQTDAAINPGNSGGPLVNIRGEVIGINSAIASGTGFYSGYGFAIPIGLARTVMNDLIEHGEVKRAIVGVSLLEVEPEDAEAAGLKAIRGAKVADFTDADSPAKKAGIEVGDIIVSVDGKPVDQVNSLQRIIRNYRVGQTAKIEVMRFGQRKEFNVKLAEARMLRATPASNPEDEEPAGAEPAVASKSLEKIGVTVSAVPASLVRQGGIPSEARTGLLVREVAPRGPSYQKFGPYDIIEEVLYPVRRDVRSIADLEQALSGLKSGQVVTLRIYAVGARGTGASRTQSIRIP
ncbi:MAG TPA: trypsin-like peptidase domain-containing protein [Gemmatimonadaceae bacterium]|nr:trypsin-like peptidase domain-containing protein [Gemmatimonadaceae bacterium]